MFLCLLLLGQQVQDSFSYKKKKRYITQKAGTKFAGSVSYNIMLMYSIRNLNPTNISLHSAYFQIAFIKIIFCFKSVNVKIFFYHIWNKTTAAIIENNEKYGNETKGERSSRIVTDNRDIKTTSRFELNQKFIFRLYIFPPAI